MSPSHLILYFVSFLTLIFTPSLAYAGSVEGEVTKQTFNPTAVAIFSGFVILTLLITWRAAKATKSPGSFYTAGGSITPLQNGLAIAGDFMSAATLLGMTSLLFFVGIDAMAMVFPVIVAWALSLMLIAEKLRNLGRFTFIDVVTYRLESRGLRVLLVICSLSVVIFYLIGQMVGAGKLIQLLFGLDYLIAVITVAFLMVTYVFFGGMIATTWVQMTKALLLMCGGALMTYLMMTRFGFSFNALMQAAAEKHSLGADITSPGGWLKKDTLNVWTVGLTISFGVIGLPHILMRFLTVKDAVAARSSVAYATLIMAIFYLFVIVIGFGAIALIWGDPRFYDSAGQLIGGRNMVALNAAKELGGDILLGFMSAVTFATILAVVAGLTLSGAASISHDLYSVVMRKGQADPKTELRLSKFVTLILGVIAVFLGVLFEKQNVLVVVSMALAIAASVNFPLLTLSIYWHRLTSWGAMIGGTLTLVISLALVILSDNVWVKVLGHEQAIYPYVFSTVFTLPLGFASIMLFSLLDRSKRAKREQAAYEAQLFRSETGIGAAEASGH